MMYIIPEKSGTHSPLPEFPLSTARVQVTLLPMRNTGRYFTAALVLCAVFISHPGALRAKDIKNQVIRETILDEEIRAFARSTASGTRERGRLRP